MGLCVSEVADVGSWVEPQYVLIWFAWSTWNSWSRSPTKVRSQSQRNLDHPKFANHKPPLHHHLLKAVHYALYWPPGLLLVSLRSRTSSIVQHLPVAACLRVRGKNANDSNPFLTIKWNAVPPNLSSMWWCFRVERTFRPQWEHRQPWGTGTF